MKRGLVIALLAALLLLAVAIALARRGGAASIDGAHPAGLRGAYRYLQERGREAEAWTADATALDPSVRVLVVAAPFAVVYTEDEIAALLRWIERGGRLVLLHSGDEPTVPELLFLLRLDLSYTAVDESDLPLGFLAWRSAVTAPVTLEADETLRGHAPSPLAAKRPRIVVTSGTRALVLYRDPEGTPMVIEVPRHRGSIVVVNNASIVSNALLGEAQNLAFLEWILDRGGEPGQRVSFDEYRHGRGDAAAVASGETRGVFEVLIAHALLLYVVALATVGRRFGRPLPEAPLPRGSVERDVLALAALHRRAGHAHAAGERLLASARRLARRDETRGVLASRFEGGEEELLRLACEIGRLQRSGKL